ncbi:MAG: hypothetical protein KA368_22895 [Acidobacteria bacterium]|nr:hypothetical protein [Acidobacteriota bacterium]
MKRVFYLILVLATIIFTANLALAQSAEEKETKAISESGKQFSSDNIFDQIKERQRKAIIGSWQITVSSAALSLEWPALGAFADGGIYKGDQVGNVSTEPIPVLGGSPIIQTDQYGSWTHLGGRQFTVTFMSYLYTGSNDHSVVGIVKVHALIALNEQENEWTGQFTGEIQYPGGRVFNTSEGRIVGKRIKAELF